MMVGSAVLGAAAGTGFALVVAMTIVLYRYYKQRRYGKRWSELERFNNSRGPGRRGLYVLPQKAKLAIQSRLNSEASCEEAEAAAAAEAVEGNESAQTAKAAQADQGATKRTEAQDYLDAQNALRRTEILGAQGYIIGPDALRRTEALAAQIEQCAMKQAAAQSSSLQQGAIRRTGAQGSLFGQGATRRTEILTSPCSPIGEETLKRIEALAAQIEQSAIKRSAAQSAQAGQGATKRTGAPAAPGSPVGQGAIKRTGPAAPGSPVGQGAIKRTGPAAPGSPVGQGAIKRTGPAAPGSPVGQGAIKRTGPAAPGSPVGQGAIKRTGVSAAQGSPISQKALRRSEALQAQIEQGGLKLKPFSGSAFCSPLAQKRPGQLEVVNEEALLRPLARFSKFSPAGCWTTHKGLETWARTARERNQRNPETDDGAREVTISHEQRTVQPASTIVPHGVNPDYPKPMEFLHQARSYPGRSFARLNRSPSLSSQGSVDSNMAIQGSERRVTCTQTRPYSPEERELLDTASGYTPPTTSTYRAASSDSRWEPRAHSSSQGSPSTSSSLVRGSPRAPSSFRLMSDYPTPSPFGTIQPDLYTQRTDPLFLPLSGCGPTLGRLHVRLKYDYEKSDLIVHLIEIHDLAIGDNVGFSEPYVRLEIVPPVDSRVRESNFIENNANPYYDEEFKFPITHDELWDRTLVFQVHDHDRFSRFDMIGDIKMEMSEIELLSSVEIWSEISRCRRPREEYQEVLFSLSYLPSAQRLTAVILKGRNLYVNPEKGSVDPFVKVTLLAEGKRAKKRKTNPRKSNRNPVWNEAFTFNVSSKTLLSSSMEIMVYDQSQELMGSNVMIGCVLLGVDEEGRERDHWIEVSEAPRKTVAMWHTLR